MKTQRSTIENSSIAFSGTKPNTGINQSVMMNLSSDTKFGHNNFYNSKDVNGNMSQSKVNVGKLTERG